MELSERLKDLKEICEVQSQPGNSDSSEYMRGLANGLLIAVAIMEGQEPELIAFPEEVELEQVPAVVNGAAFNRAMEAIAAELKRATTKHPHWPQDMVYKAAIVQEESGELIRAAVQYEMEGGALTPIIEEAVQTASTCIRLIINSQDIPEFLTNP